MAEYIYMQNFNKYGKMGISYKVIEHVAYNVCKQYTDIVQISDNPKDKAVRCSIAKGKAYLSLNIKVLTGENASQVASKMQEEIATNLNDYLELTDCTINVNVTGIF